MKNKLRYLTTATLVLGMLAAGYLLVEPRVKAWRNRHKQTEATQAEGKLQSIVAKVRASNVTVDTSGDRQLLLAIARLEQRHSVTARLQHEAHVEGLRLDGRGEYLQQGRGTRRHVRWLLETQHEGVRASLLQSTDGRFLWTDRHIATGRHIERVDLWQLRRMSKRDPGGPTTSEVGESAPFSPQLASSFGGLPMLLESLRTHFEFTAPRTFRAPEMLGLGAQPVLGLVGRWRPESLAGVLADLSDVEREAITSTLLVERLEKRLATGSLPSRLPMNVLILLGQNDLFPYLIEYRSADDPLTSSTLTTEGLFQLSRQPLARLEYFDVVFDREIGAIRFEYRPPDEPGWSDGTSRYVDRIENRESVQLAQQKQKSRVATGQDGLRH